MLGCHEVENLYLQPEAVAVLLERAGRDLLDATAVIQAAADHFAGLWVAQHAASRLSSEHDLAKDAVSALSNATHAQLGVEWPARRAASAAEVNAHLAEQWGELLDAAWTEFNAQRMTADWYRRCLGKQTLSRAAAALEFKSGEALERQVVGLWNAGLAAVPGDLLELREYVGGLAG